MTVTPFPRNSSSERSARPDRAYASGPVPYRTMVLGAGAIAGADRLALAEALATGLAVRTGHGVDVDSVDGRPLADWEAGGVLAGHDLSHLDALVVVLDGKHGAAAAREAVRDLTESLTQRLPVGAALVVVIPPAGAGGFTSRDQDRLAVAARESAGELVPVVRLDELPGAAADERVTRWATDVAEATANALIDPMVEFMPDDPFDEFRRVEAVARVGHRYTEWNDAFQDVVDAARGAYGTPSAAMSIIDDETTRYFTRTGDVAVSLPRGKTVCNRVMRIYGGLILGDARLDTRFAGLPEVKAGDVRFYAGYRITGPDGAPFGALCVFDNEPRDVRDEDLTALRDLALDAQRRLWALIPEAPTA